jgi:hypothetical protein
MFDVLVTEDYAFRAEVDEMFQVNLHAEAYNWNKTVLKDMRKVFEDAKEGFRLEGFSKLYTISPNPKFCRLFAGHEDLGVISINGEEHSILSWDLGG